MLAKIEHINLLHHIVSFLEIRIVNYQFLHFNFDV